MTKSRNVQHHCLDTPAVSWCSFFHENHVICTKIFNSMSLKIGSIVVIFMPIWIMCDLHLDSKWLSLFLTGKNVLDKPRLLRPLPCYIEKISVNLNPSIDKFEEELCKQVNEDRINREQRVADGSTISIQERRLQVYPLTCALIFNIVSN